MHRKRGGDDIARHIGADIKGSIHTESRVKYGSLKVLPLWMSAERAKPRHTPQEQIDVEDLLMQYFDLLLGDRNVAEPA